VVIGGYQIWDDDAPVPAWESLSIYWPPVDDPGVSGAPFGLNLSGITRGTDTWTAGLNLTCENRSVNSRYRDTNYRNQDGETRSGWFWVVPDLERSVVRATGDDYAAMIARYGLPKVEQLGDHGWGESSNVPTRPEDLTNYEDSRTDLLPLETQQLATVINATHIIEAPLSADALHLPMIYAVGHSKSELHGPGIAGGATCSDNGIDPPAYEANIGEAVAYRSMLQTSYNASGELDWFDYDEGGSVFLGKTSLGDFDGKDSVVRFWQNWAHSLWLYWYQPNDLNVDGGSVDWEDYSYPLGQQWLYDSSLASLDRRYTRTDLVSMQGIEGGNSAPGQVIESNISGADHPSSWWGNWGYETDQWALPASIQSDADSEDRWTIEDGGGTPLTATFGGSDISVTIGTGDVIALFELASFTDEPYLYPSIAQRFEVLRDSTTVDRIRCYLVGADGSEVELNETDVQTAGGANWPASGLVSTTYLGTWGRTDYGQGVVTDAPSDTLGSGESATAMADRTRCTVPQLLPGRTAKWLKIVATPKAATDPIKLKYPKFFAPTLAPEVRYLGRQMAAVIWPDGPGIVLGNWRFWDYTLDTFLSTPEIRGIGSKTSAMDALCTRNLFEGKVSDDGLNAKIGTLYDEDIEFAAGTERIQTAYNTIAWWVISEDKVAACLQNCYIPPPLAWFPPRQRDSDYLLASDRALEVLDWCKEPRDLILPGSTESQVKDTGGTAWTAYDATSPSGWKITRHFHAVDNTETGFHVARLGTNYAEIRPWHGILWVFGTEESDASGNVSHDIHRSGLRVRAYVSGGTAWAGKATRRGAWADTDTTLAAQWVSVRVEKSGKSPRVFLVVADSGAIKEYVSPDGVNYTLSSTLASGTLKYPAQDVEHDGTRYTYWLDSTTIKGLVRDRAGNTLATVSSAITGVDDSGFSVRKTFALDGKFRIEIQCIISGAVVEYVSPDGITFS